MNLTVTYIPPQDSVMPTADLNPHQKSIHYSPYRIERSDDSGESQHAAFRFDEVTIVETPVVTYPAESFGTCD